MEPAGHAHAAGRRPAGVSAGPPADADADAAHLALADQNEYDAPYGPLRAALGAVAAAAASLTATHVVLLGHNARVVEVLDSLPQVGPF